ncbi:MAG: phosphoribosyl-AMP cyclohydrolase [Candidatus Kinetoplastibacterium crithidii]|nr:MAG: phosphoribosyl-AMP cyclohydrolase [Candidatus Kinetoplastibacterium crithidii]
MNHKKPTISWMDELKFDKDGLIPVIAQDYKNGDVLMMAWMNKEALQKTISLGKAVYWSRSRKKLWEKGEESGHTQIVQEIRLDCDGDVILLKVNQLGNISCHTGRKSCFFRVLKNNDSENKIWTSVDEILKNPKIMYKNE